MQLHRIKDFDPDYRAHFEEQDVMGYDLYAGADKIGSVDDLLVDDAGKIRYLIINTGFWIIGKKVLLPIGRAQIDFTNHRVMVNGLTREQVEAIPEYDDNMPIDYDYEEQVRAVYRPIRTDAETGTVASAAHLNDDRNTYAYDHDPALYDLNDGNHQNLRLYEERLIANKTRAQTGEVAFTKRIETETAKVSMPIEKERVVIERTTPSSATVTADATAFQEGEVVRLEVYEETPDIHKETFVREEVKITKEVERETVNAEETLRSEKLDVDRQGRPVVEEGSELNRPKALNK